MSYRPRQPREHASTKAVLAVLYRQAGGAKRVADLIKRSPTQTYAYADPAEGAEITLDDARKIARFHPDAIALADDFASLAGGAFLPCPAPNGTIDAIAAETAEQWGSFTAVLIRALHHDELCKHSKLEPQLRARCDHLIFALGQIRARLVALEGPAQ